MNKYAKAIIATLGALAAALTAKVPGSETGWIQEIAVALGAGIVTFYVPNTTPTVVIPPQSVVDNTPKLQGGPNQ